jgi:hypothetical protein
LPILRQEEAKKVTQPEYLVAQFQYNKLTIIHVPKEKTTGRWHKKSVEQKRLSVQEIPNPPKLSSKTIYAPVDQQEEKSIEPVWQVEENNKRYQENPHYTERQRDKRNIFGTIKDNGVTITQFNGTRVNGEHSLIMLVYNIKRSYWRMSDLIAKLKNGTHPTKQQLVLSVTNYLGF